MSGFTARMPGRGSRLGRSLGAFWAGISAISTKELRGRMRGRRAFVVLTIYLLLLSVFAFAIYVYLKQQAAQNGLGSITFPRGGIDWWPGETSTGGGTALSAIIGHAIFGGLLGVETLLVLVLAPAFTTGAISLEREKQTLDLLVTTPLSTLGMVIGKLLSALSYVFLLIIASIPLASLVFVFGGVGPEDLVRGYVFLFALAFGMGAIGLFISALVKRTQTATVLTFIVVLVLAIGSAAVHQFWLVAARPAPSGSIIVVQRPSTAPEALLWLNPFVANIDLVCATSPEAYNRWCSYMSTVTGKPYYGSTLQGVDVEGDGLERGPVLDCPPNAGCEMPPDAAGEAEEATAVGTTLGFPRDTFWPKSAAAFVVLGIALTLLSSQLVAPTRRLQLPFVRRRRLWATARLVAEPTSTADATDIADSTVAIEDNAASITEAVHPLTENPDTTETNS